MFNAILRKISVFLIFDIVVCRKGWFGSETDQNLVHVNLVYTDSRLLSAQGQPEAIQCISDFRQDYIITSAIRLLN